GAAAACHEGQRHAGKAARAGDGGAVQAGEADLMAMGDLARTDEYDPFAAETFVPQPLQDWTTQAASKDVDTLRSIGHGMGEILKIPEQVTQNSQFALDTGTYDPRPTLDA